MANSGTLTESILSWIGVWVH